MQLILLFVLFYFIYSCTAAPKSLGGGGEQGAFGTTFSSTSGTTKASSSSSSTKKATSSTSSTAKFTTTNLALATSSTTTNQQTTTNAALVAAGTTTGASVSSTTTVRASSQLASLTTGLTGFLYTATYTATFSNQVNIGLGGPAFITAFYVVEKDTIRVAGSAGIAATAANTLSSFDMSLPIAMASPSTGFIQGACLIEDTADFLSWEGLINPQTSTRVRVYFTPSSNFIIGNVNWDLTYKI
jgi:hypothetical protein